MSARITDPKTSHDAAKIRPKKKADVRAIILAELRKRKRGLADFQLEEIVTKRAGVTPQRVRTVRAELAKPAKTAASKVNGWEGASGTWTWRSPQVTAVEGVYRESPTGRKAQVWRAVA